jgi:hypothetical protein
VRVRTDDEVYRVDAVWLGPPKATFPWRARYVAWGVGILVFFLVLTGERWVGFGFGFFTVAWALVITVVVTRLIGSRISHERPLGAVFTMWVRELTSPRESAAGGGGAASATRIRVRAHRPRPKPRRVNHKQGRSGRSGRIVQSAHNVPQVQSWAGQPRLGQGGTGRRRGKEVGGVRTQGRT